MPIAIDQAAVLAGSITPGDTPGFPARLSRPGSYILTGNLTVPATVANAIQITSSHLTLDLNGFHITRASPDFTPAIIAASAVNFVKVVNGHISAMSGVELPGIGNRVEGLQIRGPDPSAGSGIVLGDMGVATDNQVNTIDLAFSVGKSGVIRNNVALTIGHGARAGENSIVAGNILGGGAAQSSVQVGDGAIVEGNITGGNDGGIQAGRYCLVKDNTLRNAGDFGIGAGDGSVITGNRVNHVPHGPGISATSTCAISNNAVTDCGEGIVGVNGTLVESNAVSGSTGFGLRMQASSGYALNVLNGNNGTNPQVSGGFQVDKNECNGAFCP